MDNKDTTFYNFRCLLFDLDDTIYPQNNGLWEMIAERINQFMIEKMHFYAGDVPALRRRLWEQYGTTLRGLQVEYSVDMDAYLSYLHDVPIEEILKPDSNLNGLLYELSQRKVIFTNATAAHAQRVLNTLGISHHFDGIVDIYNLAPYCKPQVEAFQITLELLKEKPENCLLVDDNPRNLATAHSLGLGTVCVGKHHHDDSPQINTIYELGKLLLL